MIGLLFFLMCADSWKEPPPEVLAIWNTRFAKADEHLPKAIAALAQKETDLQAAKRAKAKATKKTLAEAGDLVRRCEMEVKFSRESIENIKTLAFSMPRLNCFDLALGQLGLLSYPDGTVGAQPATFTVLQVLGPTEMLLKTGQKATLVRGLPTDGLVDDGSVTIRQVLRVSKTERYTTTDGATNTVFVLEPHDTSQLDHWLPQLQKTRWRRWTDATGKFSIEARAVDFQDDTVTLRKLDDSEVQLPFSKLSKEDQRFLTEAQGANHETKKR
jgi:hypothetical protein